MNGITGSSHLRETIDLVRPWLREAGREMWDHPQIDRFYAEYLFTMHCVIRASVPLMRAGLERSYACAATEPLAAGISSYLSAHIPEELQHDGWLLDDLEVLGIPRAATLQRLPSSTVAAVVGSQYYWIHHTHPVALLGYIAVLEGDPATPEEVEQFIARTSLPRNAFRTLYKHALLDPQHRADLDRVLDELPLDPCHASLLGMSAIYTAHGLAQALQEIADSRF